MMQRPSTTAPPGSQNAHRSRRHGSVLPAAMRRSVQFSDSIWLTTQVSEETSQAASGVARIRLRPSTERWIRSAFARHRCSLS